MILKRVYYEKNCTARKNFNWVRSSPIRNYVQTYKAKENKEEYVIMDLKGNIIKRVYIQKFDNVTLTGKMLGTKLHTIYNDKLYYLVENEDEEEWELHVEEIK
jgi:hypothetical protein